MNLAWQRLLQIILEGNNDGGGGGGGGGSDTMSGGADDEGEDGDDRLDEPGDAAKKLKEWQQYARRLRNENATKRTAVKTLKQQNEELQRKLQTETEAIRTAAKSEAEARLQTETTKLTERIIRSELKAEAAKAGIIDFDGLKLVDVSSIKLNDAGEIEGAAEVIAQLKESKPYLFTAPSSTATTTSTAKAPDPADPKPKLATEMTQEEYEAAKAALTKMPVRRRA